jgi:hypothetical protein
LHSLSRWSGSHEDEPPVLVLFGGQLTSRIAIPSDVSPTTEPTLASGLGISHKQHEKEGGGGDYHMLDDDSTWSWTDNTVHAQINDIWVYLPTKDTWQLISTGGCHRGDNGELLQPKVDLTALFVVGVLATAGLLGIMMYQVFRKYSRSGYDVIPDGEEYPR